MVVKKINFSAYVKVEWERLVVTVSFSRGCLSMFKALENYLVHLETERPNVPGYFARFRACTASYNGNDPIVMVRVSPVGSDRAISGASQLIKAEAALPLLEAAEWF
jgi:hypothetical protein